ncbi:MAG TPA: c-type cytochrome [Flavipsychrobacter sp.]|nr:c-type cytochrome [Flavipsychrobacter sp.]
MKRKIFKTAIIILLIVVAGVASLLAYVKMALPDVGEAANLTIERTPERIERGKYLANHVMVCIDCHSKRDWSLFAGPPIAGTEGMGGELFDQKLGFPGKFVAPNITPANISGYTDGELIRAITCGVAKDGRALFPVMPYNNFGQLDEEDIRSVIAYIRTLKPIQNKTGNSAADFPMNFIMNTIPHKANFQPIPESSDLKAYGKYLVTAASCYDCHTKQEKGQFVGQPFAGGMEFQYPDGSIARSANITPHATGIAAWNEQAFINRFKSYTPRNDSGYVPQKLEQDAFQTVMPWTMYAGMTEQDLKAIFAYLQSVQPVENTVTRFTPATNK